MHIISALDQSQVNGFKGGARCPPLKPGDLGKERETRERRPERRDVQSERACSIFQPVLVMYLFVLFALISSVSH